MKINKDLVDAVMMMSFICLVLVGTSEFDSETTQHTIMILLGAITVAMVALRFIGSRKQENQELTD
ncbi:hypothetical protein [Parabacteroides sp. PF5-6]|uniref:hypothetical protein n=1 Tax=Parabacteroides sp. PF5-6 TaxID=1742403 RepID=UPI002406CFDE|nr:hypothetical protein [Parabacteroides sp. PF5-6]MDF9831694.1 hypothetical protein [Parabacteroides sp. PF5-6]